ncbi:MAG: type III pantothenate kinase [Inquilinus sp.]|nr:type III pantothenate kinase [Inquilinus sp.]
MLLAIDSGNTNVVFAVYDGAERRGIWRIATEARRTSDEYAVWLLQLMAMAKLKQADITDAIIASVVPTATFNLIRLCQHHFDCTPLEIGAPGVDLGVGVKLDSPGDVGADRLVNAVAAREILDPPLIVVDFGTATTFDIVDGEGDYCGGVIAPGINLSIEALHRAAAKLPKVEVARPKNVIGKSTIGAMQSGIFWGYVGLVEGLVGRIKAEYGAPMHVLATGGLAPLFSAATDQIEAIDGELTMRGLVRIFERNRKT